MAHSSPGRHLTSSTPAPRPLALPSIAPGVQAAQAALHQTLAGLLQLLGPGPTLSGRTSTLSGAGGPLIRLEVHLLHASVALVPSVATVQKELQGLVLEVGRG